MTVDNRLGNLDIQQTFNLERMIEAAGAYMDARRSLSELIDNALDETPAKECSQIVITFNPNPSSIQSAGVIFEHKNTTGMSAQKMQEFAVWGDTHLDENKYKQWGLGGKLAILHWLDRKVGSVDIVSREKSTSKTVNMTIENWWKKLRPNEIFTAESRMADFDPNGFTRFELRGVNKEIIPTQNQIVDLANHLGLVYGKLIKGNRLNITLRRFNPKGVLSTIGVEAIEPPFDHERSDSKPISISSPNGTIRMELTWGLLDIEERNKETKKRAAVYDSDPSKLEICSGGIYIYNHSRYLTTVPLAELKIPRTSTGSLQSFAAVLNIYYGVIAQNLLKTGLSLPSQTTNELYKRIKKEIEPHIQEIARLADPIISVREKKNIEEVEKKFKAVLEKIFKNNRDMAESLHLTKEGLIYSSAPGNVERKNPENETPRIPGLRSSQGNTSRERQGKIGTVYANPIPNFEISTTFTDEYPPSRYIVSESGSCTILFNRKHPAIKHALETKNTSSTSLLLYMAARAFYHQKWAVDSEGNPDKYSEGIEKDAAFYRYALGAC